MNRIVHQHDRLKSTLWLGMTYRLTIWSLSRRAQTFVASRTVEAWESLCPGFAKDMKRGIQLMLNIGQSKTESIIITYKDAYNILKVLYFLAEQSAILTGRDKVMLQESLWIFADCCPFPLKVAYVLPFAELDPDIRLIPVIAKHYPGVEAKANLHMEGYIMGLADAMDFLEAIRGIRGVKMVLLRHSLEAATLLVRTALENISEVKS